MALKDIRVVLASTDVPQAIQVNGKFHQSIVIQSLAGNEVAAVGPSTVNRQAGSERGMQLYATKSINFSKGNLSEIYISGKAADVFTITYNEYEPDEY
jgi:hypothetical protein